MQEFCGHMALVILGILLIEVGVWKLAHKERSIDTVSPE
jgi:hypothetical protein